jgi:hypothetical protein
MHFRLEEAKRLLDKIPGMSVKALIVGHDLNHMMSVHMTPLPDGKTTPDTVWAAREDLRINLNTYRTNIYAIAAVACLRWPKVKVYDCKCTCCCDGLEEVSHESVASFAKLAEAIAA